ncbi:efflux RND transporter periplasmic adaptor subunit [Glaciecola sp. 1036]|uniref:efflux RND transporter periplasmic adaptor subunit n=1 Tax=Alteromonadaceae TaxID=72275 RepID=UPI003D044B05
MKLFFPAFIFLSALAFFAQAQTSVIVATVEQNEMADTVEALGTLRANESVDLTANVTEMITAVHFQDGQRVNRGDVLVEMDDSEQQALLAEEMSRLNEAKKQVSRLSSLAAQNASTESLLDEQQREVETAEARIKAIRSRLALRTIKAPFAGVLGLRNVSVGSLVRPGDTITTLDDDSVMKLDFSVPSVFLPVLGSGVEIKAKSDAFKDEIFDGKVLNVDSRIDPVTRSIIVRAIIPNPERKLKPGLLMTVTIQANPRQALIIPEEALIPSGNKNFVLVLSNKNGASTVERRQIELGTRRAGEAEIVQGLSAGDKVVTHGITKALPGAEVTVLGEQTADVSITSILQSSGRKG